MQHVLAGELRVRFHATGKTLTQAAAALETLEKQFIDRHRAGFAMDISTSEMTVKCHRVVNGVHDEGADERIHC